MARLLSSLALLATLAPSFLDAQTARGFVRIGTDRRELHFARAAEVPDDLDKTKKMIHVVLSEAEIPSKALFDGMALFDIRSEKKNQVVELNFREDAVNWFLTGKEMEGTLSMSRSPNPFPYQILAGAIKGQVEEKSEPDDKRRNYEISVTYQAPLEKAAVEAAPTAADAAAAMKHPAVKAYLNLMDAIRKGDKARILAAAPEEQKSRIDSPDFPKMLAMIQSMQPSEVNVLKVVEKDGEATLSLTGVQEGKKLRGEVTLKFEEGKWIMRSESWHN